MDEEWMTLKVTRYKGSRDIRFVTVRRGGLLDDAHHRLLARWAADCAEHVLPLFTAKYPHDDRPRHAIETARAWAEGKATVLEARQAAYAAHAAARDAKENTARFVARAAGHAVATVHMADHELGAAAFAIRAVCSTVPQDKVEQTRKNEIQWQHEHLPKAIRELVLSDEEQRNQKLWSLFS
jgi:hypothetical protein